MGRCLFYLRNSIGCHICDAECSKHETAVPSGNVTLVKYFMKISCNILTGSGTDWRWETNGRTERIRQSVVVKKMHNVQSVIEVETERIYVRQALQKRNSERDSVFLLDKMRITKAIPA
jgi:hypothetical protein